MDKLIESLVNGDLDTASLLMLFIVGILTKRFVPWWVHEEVLEKLEQYEEAAPALLEVVDQLNDLLNDPKVLRTIEESVPEATELTERTTKLRRTTRLRTKARPRKRT